jgi:hypothetical protein
MIDQFNVRRISFLISYLLIFNIAQADAIRETLKNKGWSRSKDYKINSRSGIFLAESYTKKIGDVDAQLVYSPSTKQLYGNKAQPAKYESPLFFFDDEIHTIHWMMGYHLTVGGLNFLVTNEKEINMALEKFQTVFSRDTKELTKIRRYKGAFGPIDIGGRGLQNVKFLGNNLFLTFMDGGQETTLELGPGFDYVSSTVANGRKINPAGVVSSPMRLLADVHRKIEEDGAKMMAAEREKKAGTAAENLSPDKNPSAATESPLANQARDIEVSQPQVIQDPKLNLLESSATTKDAVVEEHASRNGLWVAIALATFVSTISYIFLKKKRRKS